MAIGLSLGLTGAGGSILTLPVLVYLADVPPRQAVGLSLFIVGTAALAGAWQRARAGDLHFKAAGTFVISGMLGAFGGSRLTHLVTPSVLMTIFCHPDGGHRRQHADPAEKRAANRHRNAIRCGVC